MGYTVFYEEAKKEKPNIRWKDILSESFKKHSMKDLGYALAAGSAFDTASPETMLKKWHKPWVWLRVFILLSVVGFGFFVLLKVFGLNQNVVWDTLIVLSCITPITTMVLYWELNVARDVSFFKLLGCFFLGGLLSIAFTLILGNTGISNMALDITNTDPNGYWEAWVAPITEDPGKLLAGLVILMLLAKTGDNIFGCTGIAIGAGVGTGFTLFETFGYVMSYSVTKGVNDLSEGLINDGYGFWQAVFEEGLDVVKSRSLPGLNGHMLMCVPYIAMIALVYHETKDWKKSVFNKKTGIAFFTSCFLHGWWDCMAGVAMLILNINENTTFATQAEADAAVRAINNAVTIQTWIITILYFACNLYVIRLCLQQAVCEGDYVSGQGMALGERTLPHFDAAGNQRQAINAGEGALPAAKLLTVTSTGSVLTGSSWQCKDTVLIGKLNDCAIQFPPETVGLSRVHCRLRNCGDYWSICDVGSSYGTHLNGARLNPNTEYRLPSGSVLELGSSKVQLRIQ